MAFFDSHLHLAECADPGPILIFARSQRVTLFSVSVDLEDSKRNLVLGRGSPDLLRVFVGIHPSEAAKGTKVEELEPLSRGADGIGEAGLDPKYSEVSEGSSQVHAFKGQLELAERLEKPIQVHSRNAEKACLETLESYEPPRVLLHWFEGEEFAGQAASKGYYISFGPALLYSKRLARIARSYPPDLLLTESDAPVTYRPLGRNVGGPLLIPSVVFYLAQLREVELDDMQTKLSENSKRFLFKKG